MFDWSGNGGAHRNRGVKRSTPALISAPRFVLVSTYQMLAWSVLAGVLCALLIGVVEDFMAASAAPLTASAAGLDAHGSPTTHAAAVVARAVATAAADAARGAVREVAATAAAAAAVAAAAAAGASGGGGAGAAGAAGGALAGAAGAAASAAAASEVAAAVAAAVAEAEATALAVAEEASTLLEQLREKHGRGSGGGGGGHGSHGGGGGGGGSHEHASGTLLHVPLLTIVLAIAANGFYAWLMMPVRYCLLERAVRVEWNLTRWLPRWREEVPYGTILALYRLAPGKRDRAKNLVSDTAFLNCRTVFFLSLRGGGGGGDTVAAAAGGVEGAVLRPPHDRVRNASLLAAVLLVLLGLLGLLGVLGVLGLLGLLGLLVVRYGGYGKRRAGVEMAAGEIALALESGAFVEDLVRLWDQHRLAAAAGGGGGGGGKGGQEQLEGYDDDDDDDDGDDEGGGGSAAGDGAALLGTFTSSRQQTHRHIFCSGEEKEKDRQQ